MSRHVPINLRPKHQHTSGQATAQNLAVLGLRIAAILCWIASLFTFGEAVFGLTQIPRTGAWMWEPAAYSIAGIAAIVVGCRLWALKSWACIIAVVAMWLLCLAYPWRPENYAGRVIDVTEATAASVVMSVIFAAPLTFAWIVARSRLRPGF